MSGKLSQLNTLMQNVSKCDLCCREGQDQDIKKDKLLINLIAEKPISPRFGEIPSMYTDWASRLNAKIAIVLQDWGGVEDALSLRRHYQEQIRKKSLSAAVAWRQTVQNRPNPSPTHINIINFLKISATLEGLKLPHDFLDQIFFTNAVLCFRHGNTSGKDNIDLRRSIRNCCFQSKFLYEQLKIVQPSIVVALGEGALSSLCISSNVALTIQSVQSLRDGFKMIDYYDLSFRLVPALHPTSHIPKGWTKDKFQRKQIADYRFIWRALSHILGCSGDKLVSECF